MKKHPLDVAPDSQSRFHPLDVCRHRFRRTRIKLQLHDLRGRALGTGESVVARRFKKTRLVCALRQVSLLALLCAAPGFADEAQSVGPPNIVLIIGDDLGYPYAGFMGDEIVETPNLDRLAAEGTTFTHAFSSASVCRPALQSLLTGLHGRSWAAQKARLQEAIGEPIPLRSEVPYYLTLPRHLARQGYRSFQGGKHWEGDFRMAGFDAGTMDELDGRPFGIGTALHFARPSLESMHDFLDDLETDEPFFLYLAPKLPHTPHDPSIDLFLHYLIKGVSTPAALYYANIARFDDMVGGTIDALEERGLRENSLIIFVSDNGWEQGPYETYFLGAELGGDRGKLSMFDIGFRTPLIFNWPGKVPSDRVLSDFVLFEDLHATILQYAGAPIPPDHEGVPLIPRIEGMGGEPERDHVIGVQNGLRVRESEWFPGAVVKSETGGYLRTDRWRYIEWLGRGEQALFHIEEDPFERNDVSADYPEMLDQFALQTADWRADLAQPTAWMDLTGRLTTEEGVSAAGLRLWLEGTDESGSAKRLEVFSGDRGFFRFPNVPSGAYTLTHEIEAPVRSWFWGRGRTAPVTESEEIDLVGYQTGPFLSIQIPGDAPPAAVDSLDRGNIEIAVRARAGGETSGLPVHLRGWTARGFVQQRVLSGPDGFVVADQLPAGFYYISVTAPRGVRTRSRWVYLRPGATERLTFKLRGRGARRAARR